MVTNENKCGFGFLIWNAVFFSVAFSSNNMVLCKHRNQLINHLARWIIIYRWIAIWWFCLCLPVCLAAVCFCDLSFSVCDQTLKMESLFEGLSVFWDWYCPAFSMDVKCTLQYIRSWQWWRCLGVSRYVCFCVSAKERETANGERWHQWSDLSAALLSSAAQWVSG